MMDHTDGDALYLASDDTRAWSSGPFHGLMSQPCGERTAIKTSHAAYAAIGIDRPRG